jgi:hypothetical protein
MLALAASLDMEAAVMKVFAEEIAKYAEQANRPSHLTRIAYLKLCEQWKPTRMWYAALKAMHAGAGDRTDPVVMAKQAAMKLRLGRGGITVIGSCEHSRDSVMEALHAHCTHDTMVINISDEVTASHLAMLRSSRYADALLKRCSALPHPRLDTKVCVILECSADATFLSMTRGVSYNALFARMCDDKENRISTVMCIGFGTSPRLIADPDNPGAKIHPILNVLQSKDAAKCMSVGRVLLMLNVYDDDEAHTRVRPPSSFDIHFAPSLKYAQRSWTAERLALAMVIANSPNKFCVVAAATSLILGSASNDKISPEQALNYAEISEIVAFQLVDVTTRLHAVHITNSCVMSCGWSIIAPHAICTNTSHVKSCQCPYMVAQQQLRARNFTDLVLIAPLYEPVTVRVQSETNTLKRREEEWFSRAATICIPDVPVPGLNALPVEIAAYNAHTTTTEWLVKRGMPRILGGGGHPPRNALAKVCFAVDDLLHETSFSDVIKHVKLTSSVVPVCTTDARRFVLDMISKAARVQAVDAQDPILKHFTGENLERNFDYVLARLDLCAKVIAGRPEIIERLNCDVAMFTPNGAHSPHVVAARALIQSYMTMHAFSNVNKADTSYKQCADFVKATIGDADSDYRDSVLAELRQSNRLGHRTDALYALNRESDLPADKRTLTALCVEIEAMRHLTNAINLDENASMTHAALMNMDRLFGLGGAIVTLSACSAVFGVVDGAKNLCDLFMHTASHLETPLIPVSLSIMINEVPTNLLTYISEQLTGPNHKKARTKLVEATERFLNVKIGRSTNNNKAFKYEFTRCFPSNVTVELAVANIYDKPPKAAAATLTDVQQSVMDYIDSVDAVVPGVQVGPQKELLTRSDVGLTTHESDPENLCMLLSRSNPSFEMDGTMEHAIQMARELLGGLWADVTRTIQTKSQGASVSRLNLYSVEKVPIQAEDASSVRAFMAAHTINIQLTHMQRLRTSKQRQGDGGPPHDGRYSCINLRHSQQMPIRRPDHVQRVEANARAASIGGKRGRGRQSAPVCIMNPLVEQIGPSVMSAPIIDAASVSSSDSGLQQETSILGRRKKCSSRRSAGRPAGSTNKDKHSSLQRVSPRDENGKKAMSGAAKRGQPEDCEGEDEEDDIPQNEVVGGQAAAAGAASRHKRLRSASP